VKGLAEYLQIRVFFTYSTEPVPQAAIALKPFILLAFLSINQISRNIEVTAVRKGETPISKSAKKSYRIISLCIKTLEFFPRLFPITVSAIFDLFKIEKDIPPISTPLATS
jgi:hypothetical protein